MRRPEQLRLRGLLGALTAVVVGLVVAWLVHIASGRQGLLGFGVMNVAGALEGSAFVVATLTTLRMVRALLRLPSSTLLSFGIATPPSVASAARPVPTVDADALVQTMADYGQVVVLDQGIPVGIAGVHPDRLLDWDEVVQVEADAALTELRPVLARAPLVAVMDGGRVIGIVTQERYLAASWGRGA